MAITHVTVKAPGETLAAVADWNAAHVVTGIPPIGSIIMYGAAAAPTGYLLCNGAAVARVGIYAALFAVIGTTYGIGDGSTTFNVPDFASKFPRGNTPGATGGSDDAVVVSHDHGGATGNESVTHTHDHTHGAIASGNQSADHTHTTTTGNQSASHTHSHTHGAIASGNQSVDHTHQTVMGSHDHDIKLDEYPFADGITKAVRRIYTGGGLTTSSESENLGTKTSGNQSADHTHSTTIPAKTSGNQSADHTHTGTSGNQSADHTHSTTIPAKTSGNASVSHTHTISSAGVVGTNANIPTYLGANFIIKY